MQSDVLKQYKNVNEKIPVPASLKEDTIELMKKNRKPKHSIAYVYGAAAMVGIVCLGIVFMENRQKPEREITICETLDTNVVQEEIELSKGTMYFQKISGEFSRPGLHLGSIEGEKVAMQEEDYFAYLGRDPLPAYLPEGMVKQDSGGQFVTKREDGTFAEDEFLITYKGDSGSFVEIVLSAEGIPEAEMAEDIAGCLVNDTELKTAYYGTNFSDRFFLAYFQADGIGYKVKSRGISQEEFIKVILSIIK